MYNKNNKEEELEKKLKIIEERKKKAEENANKGTSSQGIYIKGLDNCLIKTAKCCSPVPGDEIVGYITQGKGVSVHRITCSNLKSLIKNQNRMIDVYWNEAENNKNYQVELEIFAVEGKGILRDILQVVENFNSVINGVDAGVNKDSLAVINLRIIVKNNEELRKIINKIGSTENVIEIKRKSK